MASLFKRSRKGELSRFWWIKFRDPKTNSVRRESTGYRHGFIAETKLARELEARRTLEERQASGNIASEKFDAWTIPFIERQYAGQPQSLLRYSVAWRTVKMFLDDNDVTLPRQVTYALCESYAQWREKPDVENGKYRAGANTARLELKFLALVMQQAVRLGFALGNPVRELKFPRAPRKKFPSYSTSDIQTIVDGIRKEPARKQQFLWPSFLVAYHHGVRLNETNVNPSRDVVLNQDGASCNSALRRVGSITFRQKGGKVRTKPLHPQLVELFTPLIAANATRTFEPPKSFAKEWHTFLHRCGLKALKPAACFHSLRVTVQNRLRKAGVPKEVRKAYLSHDSKPDVNAFYDRIEGDEEDIEEVELDEMLACHAPLMKCWK